MPSSVAHTHLARGCAHKASNPPFRTERIYGTIQSFAIIRSIATQKCLSGKGTDGKMTFDSRVDSSDKLFKITFPKEIRVRTWSPSETPSEELRHPSSIGVVCGSCGRPWKADVNARIAGQLRYTEDGWQAQCPFCMAVNVRNVKR